MTAYARRDSMSLENRVARSTPDADGKQYLLAVRAKDIGLRILETGKWIVVDKRPNMAQATELFGRATGYLGERGEVVLISQRGVGPSAEVRILQRHRATGAVPTQLFSEIDVTSRNVFWDRVNNTGAKLRSAKTITATKIASKQRSDDEGRNAALLFLGIIGAAVGLIWLLTLPGVMPVLSFFVQATVNVVTFR